MDDKKILLKEAKKHIRSPLGIVDPYDFTFVWVSSKLCKLTGYDESELLGSQTFKIRVDKPIDIKVQGAVMAGSQIERVKVVPVKTKKGNMIKAKIRIVPFNFKSDPYLVAELLDVIK